MVENNKFLNLTTYLCLGVGIFILCFPIFYALLAASLPIDEVSKIPMPIHFGSELFINLSKAWSKGDFTHLFFNSLVMALGISLGKISISILSAFAITYFDFRFRQLAFWIIFLTLMLPVEVRIVPTYEVASNILLPLNLVMNFFTSILSLNYNINFQFSLLDSYTGLILPLIASATATFLFRQFFLTIPEELCEAAKVDGAGPLKFFVHILLPLSKTNIASLFVITFVYGWNQYLWPLLVTTKPAMKTAIIGLKQIIPLVDDIPEWNVTMAGALLLMIPPVIVVVILQKYFVKGLIETEK